MRPYVVKQGDYVTKLAYEMGFDADTIWQDAKNDDLRKQRPDPNILCPGDVLYVPDTPDPPPPGTDLTVGATNDFTTPVAPQVTVTVKLLGSQGKPQAGKAYSVQELPDLSGLQTAGDGVATFPAPVTLDTATLVLADTGETFMLRVGAMDPVDSLPGIAKRLVNLGLVSDDDDFNAEDIDVGVLRVALNYLRTQQLAPASDAAPDSSAEDDGSSDDSPPASGAAPGSAASSGEAGASTDTADDGDADDQGSCIRADNAWYGDDVGLSGDGTLTPEMRKLLLDAHGR